MTDHASTLDRLITVVTYLQDVPIGAFTVTELSTLMTYQNFIRDVQTRSGPTGSLNEQRVGPDLDRLQRMADQTCPHRQPGPSPATGQTICMVCGKPLGGLTGPSGPISPEQS